MLNTPPASLLGEIGDRLFDRGLADYVREVACVVVDRMKLTWNYLPVTFQESKLETGYHADATD